MHAISCSLAFSFHLRHGTVLDRPETGRYRRHTTSKVVGDPTSTTAIVYTVDLFGFSAQGEEVKQQLLQEAKHPLDHCSISSYKLPRTWYTADITSPYPAFTPANSFANLLQIKDQITFVVYTQTTT
jgi:hypothetical protein